MKNFEKLLNLAKNHNGYIFTKDVIKQNIPKDYLKYAVNEGVIEKVAKGIYITTDTYEDLLFIYQKTNTRVVYSAYTSAYLLNLTTRDTEKIYGTTPMRYNKTKLCKDNYIIGEKDDIYNLGITKIKTMFDNEVVCHDIHRTICDLFSPKYIGDKFVQVEALKNYLNSKDKDITKLMSYAKKLKVDKELREKLEVLL